jgi:hypothetical protein
MFDQPCPWGGRGWLLLGIILLTNPRRDDVIDRIGGDIDIDPHHSGVVEHLLAFQFEFLR